MDTLFHKIRDGEVDANIVYEDDAVIAFLDINPATPGHTLIIPRDHHTGLHDTPPKTWASMMAAARTLAERYEERLGCDGFNIVQSTGRAAEQEIPYVHVHLIPRYEEGGFRLWHERPADDDVTMVAEKLS